MLYYTCLSSADFLRECGRMDSIGADTAGFGRKLRDNRGSADYGVILIWRSMTTNQFNEEELIMDSYGTYSELDSLGRCGTAQACVGRI